MIFINLSVPIYTWSLRFSLKVHTMLLFGKREPTLKENLYIQFIRVLYYKSNKKTPQTLLYVHRIHYKTWHSIKLHENWTYSLYFNNYYFSFILNLQNYVKSVLDLKIQDMCCLNYCIAFKIFKLLF